MRRHLHFGVDEWRALPWWKTRMYIEGLNHEFAEEDTDEVVSLESLGVSWG